MQFKKFIFAFIINKISDKGGNDFQESKNIEYGLAFAATIKLSPKIQK